MDVGKVHNFSSFAAGPIAVNYCASGRFGLSLSLHFFPAEADMEWATDDPFDFKNVPPAVGLPIRLQLDRGLPFV